MMEFLPPSATGHAAPRASAGAPEVDACAYLFRACRDLQWRYRAQGIEVLFDVEPVRLPETVCRAIAALARAVLDDAVGGDAPSGGTLTLTLRRRGAACAVAIADQGLRRYDGRADPEPVAVHRLAGQLGAGYRIRAAGDRRMVALVLGAGGEPAATKGFQIRKVAC